MTDFEILIIGGGASGMIAARELSKSGRKVAVLEAQERLGGRINTITLSGFSQPVEAGAEFVHGNLLKTISLLKEAGIPFYSMEGKTYQVKNKELIKSGDFIDDSPEFISRLFDLEEDMPLSVFLDLYFKDKKYKSLRESVTRFAEGFDAADITKVSSFALRDEWSIEDTSESYRIQNGYSRIINFLADECYRLGAAIYLSTVVKKVIWKPDHVEVIDSNGKSFSSRKVLITIPLGVLNAEPDSKGYISFNPEIPDRRRAMQSMGFGTVIKLFFEFKEAFWEENKYGKQYLNHMPELGFVLSDAEIPTWWSQLPQKVPLLTGWLAGPRAEKYQHSTDETLTTYAINSLAYIFCTDKSFIEQQLKAKHFVNWQSDQFVRGAYSYLTVHSKEAIKLLSQPVENALYFAGEALYDGPAMGTVEAALVSGINAAKEITKHWNDGIVC